jgi:ferredoxin-NADP reductase
MRSYSIASAPSDSKVIELAIERLLDGEVSPFFHDVAQVGDTIELRGPLGGHFLWPGPSNKPVLLIGAGSGCAAHGHDPVSEGQRRASPCRAVALLQDLG